MDKQNTSKKNKIIIGVLLLFGLLFAFAVTYKAKVQALLNDEIQCTLMSEHKENSFVSLSEEMPAIWETIQCDVPRLKEIKIQCKGITVVKGENITFTLMDDETGEVYAEKSGSIEKYVSEGSNKYITLRPKKMIKDSEGKLLRLCISLEQGGRSEISFTANRKQMIVRDFSGVLDNKANIIYSLSYYNGKNMGSLYVILCVMLLLFGSMCYYFFVWCEYDLKRVFIPVALMFGFIMTFVTMVHGIPDEPDHINTAYHYANLLLFVEEPEAPNMIYKRSCDARMTDMLANGLESNSYYQMQMHFFELPEDTEYIAVSYADTSHIVPGIVYIPAAIGIAIGRLLGLSALLTITLGRLFNLVIFVLFIWWAMHVMPYGKNALGMVMLLPIALQQGASCSYDPMITGVIVLFIALCLGRAARVDAADSIGEPAENRKRMIGEIVLLIVLTVFIAVTKGGVYFPVCLLIFAVPRQQRSERQKMNNKKNTLLIIIIVVILAAVVCAVTVPMIYRLLENGAALKDGNTLYSVGYVFKHPLKVIYMYWNTVADNGGTHLAGLLGGRLSWLDVKINWIYLLVIWTGLLLLVNIEGEKYNGNKKSRILIVISCAGTIILIMASMLLAFTTISEDSINGLQGRYYLPIFPCLLLLAATDMVAVKPKQASRILMMMMMINILIVLQTVTQVLS